MGVWGICLGKFDEQLSQIVRIAKDIWANRVSRLHSFLGFHLFVRFPMMILGNMPPAVAFAPVVFFPTTLAHGVLTIQKGIRLVYPERAVPLSRTTGSPNLKTWSPWSPKTQKTYFVPNMFETNFQNRFPCSLVGLPAVWGASQKPAGNQFSKQVSLQFGGSPCSSGS